MSSAMEVTAASFDADVVKSELPVLLDFFADWCMPCKMMSPVLDEAAGERAGKVVFGKVNTENDPELASRFGITSIPCLILFKGGSEAGRRVGACSKDELLAWVDESI
ncbi:MAG: thioredoxin [Planctomycetes bacterium]|nr:thioredoxin [Planctomycetota bacterium]